MNICIVGSRKRLAEDDYGSQAWSVLAPNLTIYGFDADADACEKANKDLVERQVNWTEVHIPLILGKAQEERTLYVTKDPMCSSLYEPNEAFLSRFAILPEISNTDFSFVVETVTLDDLYEQDEIRPIDFLKTDVQGADLDVLQGATKVLSTGVLAVQVEVCMASLYKGQPLFSDVDMFLRSKSYSFFNIMIGTGVRARSPICSKLFGGQALWGDAFYFRDLLSQEVDPRFKTAENILKLACIAEILEFPDYTLELLEYLTISFHDQQQYNCADVIVEGLFSVEDLIKQGLETLPVVQNVRPYLTDRGIKLLTQR